MDGDGRVGERNERARHQGASAPRYRSWVIRHWAGPRRADAADLGWRYSLEDPQSGARLGFASLPELVAFLQADRGDAPSGPGGERPGGWRGGHPELPLPCGDPEGSFDLA